MYGPFLLCLGREGGREDMGEKHWSVICSPDVGIELETPQCMEGCSNQLSHLTRALFAFCSLPGIFLLLTSLRHCWLNWVIFSVPSLPFICARGGLNTNEINPAIWPACFTKLPCREIPTFPETSNPLAPHFYKPTLFLLTFLQISLFWDLVIFSLRMLCPCSLPAFLSLHVLFHTLISHLIHFFLKSFCSSDANLYVCLFFPLYFPMKVRGIMHLTLGNPAGVEE